MNVYEEVAEFYQRFRGEKTVFGKSAEGRDLFAFHIGEARGPQMISQYAIHGREWITGLLALSHVRRGLLRGGAWILPLTNPDGALLSEAGIGSVSEGRREFLLRVNGGEDFSLWKANANAVDLNVNFGAQWGTGEKNVTFPSPENYIGPAPFSEPETKALKAFTLAVMPALTVSWHTKGETVYWRFFQPHLRKRRDRRLAAALADNLAYPLGNAGRSAGGYKDWCVETLKIPAFTVEAGSDGIAHPLGRETLPALTGRTVDALVALFAAYFGMRHMPE